MSMENNCLYKFILKNVLLACVLILFTACSLEGDINALRIKPDETASPSIPAPDAPVITASDGLLTVKWAPVDEAENYEIYISTLQSPPSLPEKTVSLTTTVLDGLVNKTVYYVWIKALNASGYSDFSICTSGIPWSVNEVPASPARPVIIAGVNQLTVNWEVCGGASSYEVYINTSVDKPPAPEIITSKTSAAITNLENDVIYYLWVRAVNNAGKSYFSPLEAGTPKIPTIAPAAPAQPHLTAGSGEITVSWQAVELAASYEVWTGTTNNSGDAQEYGGDITNTETVITGLTNDITYYVWIRAKNSIGTSGFSPPANGKPSVFAALPETPAAPSVISGNREITVNWQPAQGALLYEIWIGESNNIVNAEKYGEDISITSVTITGLTNEITYYVWVRAKNNIGTGGFSPIAIGTPSVFALAPSAPQTAPNVITGSGQLTVSWQSVEGAIAYEIWTGTENNTSMAAKHGNDIAGLSAVITGLTNGATYYVWIKAKNNYGTSSFSPTATGIPQIFTSAPQAPAAPVINIGSGQIIISWAAVQGATAYEIWQGTENNSASAVKYGADINTSLSVTINGLSNGTIYYFWLNAKNSYGTSGFSPAVSGKPIANAVAPSIIAGNAQITVNWTDITGADQYEIFIGTGTNPPQTATITVNVPTTTTAITGLVNGTSYNVWIRGKNSTGNGTMSSPANSKPIDDMGTVTLNAGNGQLTVSWSPVAGADEYEVYYSTTNSIPASPVQTLSSTMATISSLTNGTTYYLWVRAKNANGGSISASVSGKPLGIPGAPTLTVGYRELSVSWAAAAGADQYEVYYGIGTATTLTATVTGTSTTITGLTGGTTYHVRLRAKNANGISDFGTSANGTPNDALSPGLYKGNSKVGNQNLNMALSYISSNAKTGDEYIIVLGGNESIEPTTLSYSGRTVGITLMGYGEERTISLASNGDMFTVNAGVTLTLDENVTLVGRSANISNVVIFVYNSGTLIMNDGKISNNGGSGIINSGNTYINGGQITKVGVTGYAAINNSGNLIMNGGIIRENNDYGILIAGNFGNGTMNGGIISDNRGGVAVQVSGVNGGKFTMNGGSISNNSTRIYLGGGGVSVGGSFIMNGGTISGNTADGGGGGVLVGGSFTMNGGTISGNTATNGGGVSVSNGYYDAIFTMNGGIISGNTALSSGGGVYVNSSARGVFRKSFDQSNQNIGIIYGSEVLGNDANGVPLRNIARNDNGHAVYHISSSGAIMRRNTTAWETDHINTTGKGLSASGNPPFGQ